MTHALHAADASPGQQTHRGTSALVVLVGGRHVERARSRGLPAVAIPDEGVDPLWRRRLAGRFVTVVMDAHRVDRAKVQRVAAALEKVGATVAVADFAPHRHDGYGLSDWLDEHPRLSDRTLLQLVAPSSAALTAVVAAA